VAAGGEGEAQLGADAVGGGDQHRVGEPRGLRVEQCAEPAEPPDDAPARGRRGHRLDQVDQPGAGFDVDACIPVTRPVNDCVVPADDVKSGA